ncbi:hypothetical protein LCGC14_1544030 [marine sediment metagenome]|uniref:Uncharacterized protein n=1 Tax=marine sediment metagenome TaxID=412755 RepID=A0A0F9IS45_9ZZZZ
MKLIRLVIAHISPPIDLDINTKIGSVSVKTLFVLNSETENWYFIYGSMSISEELNVTPENLIIIPNDKREEIEKAIEGVVNFIVVSTRSTRTFSSPIPYILLNYENDKEKKMLEQNDGFSLEIKKIPSVSPKIEFDNNILNLLQDRLGGIALLAEALSHSHPTGRFHEILRLFERAFHCTSSRLIKPLTEFLLNAKNQGYSKPEIENWVVTLRHPATHADRKDYFVLEAGIRPVVHRMEQAAYDVLFNKKDWRIPTSARREIWKPISGTSSDKLDLFIIKGKGTSFNFQLLDGFSSYPLPLLDFSSVLPKMIPENWWYKDVKSIKTSGIFNIVEPD